MDYIRLESGICWDFVTRLRSILELIAHTHAKKGLDILCCILWQKMQNRANVIFQVCSETMSKSCIQP